MIISLGSNLKQASFLEPMGTLIGANRGEFAVDPRVRDYYQLKHNEEKREINPPNQEKPKPKPEIEKNDDDYDTCMMI